LAWEPYEPAQRYAIEVARDPQFRSIVLQREAIEGSGVVLPTLPAAHYWWRVAPTPGGTGAVPSKPAWSTSEFGPLP
jgi:hypothetical protein